MSLWTGILNSGRAVDWDQQAATTFSIPSGSWSQCVTAACNTVTSAGSGATALQISSAISSAPANSYVLLQPGIYNLNGRINLSTNNVVLRGSGPKTTILRWTAGGGNCGAGQGCGVLIGVVGVNENSASVQPGQSNALDITGTIEGGASVYPWGATHITVANVGSDKPQVGTILFMDQINDQTPVAGVIQGDNPTLTAGLSMSGNNGAFGRAINSGASNSPNRRSQTQASIVTACTPNCTSPTSYTISPGIYFNNIRSSQSPGAWWNTSSNKITNAGLENLTVESQGTINGQAVTFGNAYLSWIKNVRFVCVTATCPRSHMAAVQSMGIIMRDCYVFGSQAGGGAEGYGVEMIETSGALIENNIFDFQIAPWINSLLTGCVFGYNYSFNNNGGSNTFMQGSYTSHDCGCAMNLYEGNDINALLADNQHGASPLPTAFRNHIGGNQPVPNNIVNTGHAQTVAINQDSYVRVGSFVGNALGMITCSGGTFSGLPADKNSQCTGGSATGPSFHTNYECSPLAGCASQNVGNQSIYQIGYGDGLQIGNPGPSAAAGGNDNEVITSMFRWGNCDSFTGTCRFQSSEVPTAGGTFYSGLSVPANNNLPASFYYSSRPAWWNGLFGTPPFPPIGPDITGGDLATRPTGIANRNLARICFENTSQDSTNYPSTNVKAFDATACYSTSSLQPPTNLHVASLVTT